MRRTLECHMCGVFRGQRNQEDYAVQDRRFGDCCGLLVICYAVLDCLFLISLKDTTPYNLSEWYTTARDYVPEDLILNVHHSKNPDTKQCSAVGLQQKNRHLSLLRVSQSLIYRLRQSKTSDSQSVISEIKIGPYHVTQEQA
jgi:hypothetical protein